MPKAGESQPNEYKVSPVGNKKALGQTQCVVNGPNAIELHILNGLFYVRGVLPQRNTEMEPKKSRSM